MKTIAALAFLSAIATAQQQGSTQSWHISFPTAFKQPASIGGPWHDATSTNLPANPGEIIPVVNMANPYDIYYVNCRAFRNTPVSVGGGFYECAYDEDEYVPLLMVAPHDIGYSSQVSGAVSGFDYLFCDPATVQSQLIYPDPTYYAAHGYWSGWVNGYATTYETFDLFQYILPDPTNPALLGTAWTLQWAMSHPSDGIKFSTAVKLWVQVTP